MFNLCNSEGSKALSKLATRETQLTLLACGGHTDKEIAKSLGIRIGTVITLWAAIRGKLGISSRAAAVAAMGWAVAKMEARYVPELEHVFVADKGESAAVVVLNRHQVVLMCNPIAASVFETQPGLSFDRSPIIQAAETPLPWIRTGPDVYQEGVIRVSFPGGRARAFMVRCRFETDGVFGEIAIVTIVPAGIGTPTELSWSGKEEGGGADLLQQMTMRAVVFHAQELLDRHSGELGSEGKRVLDRLRSQAIRLAEGLAGQAAIFGRTHLSVALEEAMAICHLSLTRIEMEDAEFEGNVGELRTCLVSLIGNAEALSNGREIRVLGERFDQRYRLIFACLGTRIDLGALSSQFREFDAFGHPGRGGGLGLASFGRAAARLGAFLIPTASPSSGFELIFDIPIRPPCSVCGQERE